MSSDEQTSILPSSTSTTQSHPRSSISIITDTSSQGHMPLPQASPSPLSPIPSIPHASIEVDINDPDQLSMICSDGDKNAYVKLGGLTGVVKSLELGSKHLALGHTIPSETSARITSQYGRNVLEPAPQTTFLELVWESLEDTMIRLLLGAATISLILAVIPATSTDPSKGWIKSVAIYIAVIAVVMITSVNNYSKEKQFRKLNAVKENREVSVLREGKECSVPISDLIVGDICIINYGDKIPADGVFISGHEITCDESGATGEPEAIRKGEWHTKTEKNIDSKVSPFFISGTKVLSGYGRMLVIAVGPHSFNGKSMLSLREEPAETPLQEKLTTLADRIGRLGMAIAVGACIVLIAKLVIIRGASSRGFDSSISADLIDIVIMCITIAVVAVPEGLPLAVTIALAYGMKKMLKDQNLVRHLAACETMGGATTICSDKTGTLTQNVMTVIKGHVTGLDFDLLAALRTHKTMFRSIKASGAIRSGKTKQIAPLTMTVESGLASKIASGEGDVGQMGRDIMIAAAKQLKQQMGKRAYEWLCDAISVNSTAYEAVSENGAKKQFVGSKTESALLEFSTLLSDSYQARRHANRIHHRFAFNSSRKRMSTLIAPKRDKEMTIEETEDSESHDHNLKLPNSSTTDSTYTLHVKGAAEIILSRCTHYLTSYGTIVPITQEHIQKTQSLIQDMNNECLRSIAMAFRELTPQQVKAMDRALGKPVNGMNDGKTPSRGSMSTMGPPTPSMIGRQESRSLFQRDRFGVDSSAHDHEMAMEDTKEEETLPCVDETNILSSETQPDEVDMDENLVLVGVVGIQDPVRPEVPAAVRKCQNAGVRVIMVTGDSLSTAMNIAKSCGIYNTGIAMEGPNFRKLSPEQIQEILPKLQVLARSSPLDKQLLVRSVQSTGEVVAVTGDGTNDAPALQLADVGFSMGIAGTEVAKEASDIIIMDDSFASIPKAIMWGRNIFDCIRCFLQFQLTVNVIAVTLTVLGALTNEDSEAPLSAVQLLWVNLIMDTFAALALATEPPTDILLKYKPYDRNESLITFHMKRNIIGQTIYQLAVTLTLLYAGPSLLQTATRSPLHNTMLFNTFVLLQLFNEFNCRKIHGEMNVFKGVLRNQYFLGVLLFSFVLQFIIVTLGGDFTNTTSLSFSQWVVCIALGAMSIPLNVFITLLPHNLLSPFNDPIHNDMNPINSSQNQLGLSSTSRKKNNNDQVTPFDGTHVVSVGKAPEKIPSKQDLFQIHPATAFEGLHPHTPENTRPIDREMA